MAHIAIISPSYDEETNLPILYARLVEALKSEADNVTFIFVNDGSVDRTESNLREMCKLDHRVKAVFLARNFSHQAVLMAGIDAARDHDGVGAYDTQCGLKILTSETFQRIRPNMKYLGFAFDVEICLLSLKTGSKVIEFPVDWRDVAGSKVRLLRDSVRMAVEVIRIRRRVSTLQT